MKEFRVVLKLPQTIPTVGDILKPSRYDLPHQGTTYEEFVIRSNDMRLVNTEHRIGSRISDMIMETGCRQSEFLLMITEKEYEYLCVKFEELLNTFMGCDIVIADTTKVVFKDASRQYKYEKAKELRG